MNWKKQVWFIFLRSLTIFMVFWLLMSYVLIKQNQERMESIVEWQYLDNARDLVPINVKSALENEKPLEEKIGYLTWLVLQGDRYNGTVLGTTRIYNGGTELVRSPLSIGYIVLKGSHPVDYYLLFDPVLSDTEQITMANIIQDEMEGDEIFVGEASGENDYPDGWPNKGQYGEVTGIVENNCVYPQKLTYYYDGREIVLVDSNHEMFDGVELTTLRFDYAQVFSVLSSQYRSAEDLLALYQRANELADMTVENHVISSASGISRGAEDGCFSVGEDFHTGVLMGRGYAYLPWRLATYGLTSTLVTTFVAALAAAIFVARGQIKTLKKERQFTRAVAHEIKTPAAVLRATAEALNEGADPERQREYLSSMVEESDRLAFMVNELLDLSRMEGSTAALKRQNVDLTALTEGIFERLRTSMERRALNLQLDLQPTTVSGDPKRLEQVLNNLAINVLHHAAPGPVTVTLKKEKKRVVLTVENQCEPVSEEGVKHLWDPFYKLDESRSGGGSGLGLAVVKNVVTLHGGTCSARTTGDRIEFRIELPVDAG